MTAYVLVSLEGISYLRSLFWAVPFGELGFIAWPLIGALLVRALINAIRSLSLASIEQAQAPLIGILLWLVKLIGSYQPRWENPLVASEFGLPTQTTVKEYVDQNWSNS